MQRVVLEVVDETEIENIVDSQTYPKWHFKK